MRQVGRLTATALLVTTLTGCYGVRYNASTLPDDAVSMTSVSTGIEGRHFVTKERAGFLLWGLWALSRPDLARIVQEQAHGQRVVNLQIQSELAPVDGLIWLGGNLLVAAGLSMVGLGAIAPLVGMALIPRFQTITIEGDLVQTGHP